ncbi:hypothetical protein PF003_g22034 [Phytophthora fragariae]|nr:hypothetical protein PF003_g22034 [Phytophthora fragariae]
MAAVTVALSAPAVGLNSPAAGAAAAEVVLLRLAHACAWFAAASLDAKGTPHAHPAENRSRKAVRRCLESRCRLSDAKLAAVYVHSVHWKRCALCAYTERTEVGRALAADSLGAGAWSPASSSSSSRSSASSRVSSSSTSLRRRRLPPMRRTGGGDSGCDPTVGRLASWSTSMGAAATSLCWSSRAPSSPSSPQLRACVQLSSLLIASLELSSVGARA